MPNLGDNIAYSATYTPGNATLPVTYSWSISPVTAGVITPNSNSANINIQWNETGNHNLLLSTTNCGGTQTHSQIISVVAAPSPVTPVAPSPIAPSPVAPSPTTPVAPSPVYDKCALTINWDNPSVICNGDNTSTVTVSVNGNNGEAVEFSVNGGAYVAANSGVNGYVSTFTSNGDNFTYDARIVGCSNSIQGVVQVCAASPAPTAPSPSPIAPSPSPVTPSPSPVACVPITGFDFRVGPAVNPGSMTINTGTVKDIDINNVVPNVPEIGSVTFRIGIYDINNAQLYLSGFSTEGSPLNYQFNDPAATKLVVGVYSGCEYLASEVSLNIV